MIARLIYLILAGLLSVACVRDISELPSSIETEVIFRLDVEGCAQTRVISDGKSVDKLVYAIITEDGQLVSRSEKTLGSGFSSSLTTTMAISMARGCTYKAVFWAQSSLCEAYELSDDLIVSVDYSGEGNDESRDAFFGVSTSFTLDDAQAEVVLRRPFAQLNVGAYPFDWEYAVGFHDFDVVKSSVMVREVPHRLNLLDGTVSGCVNARFAPGDLPAQMLRADVDENGVDEEYTYLSMSYILAGGEATVHSADVYFMDAEGRTVMMENDALSSVELRRNCHTDIVGQTLTASGALNQREYIDAQSVYHNISEDTVLSDKIYNMSGHDAVRFASESGQKFTLDNVYITGDIWTIELGEYRGSSYVNYNNELNNVVLKDLKCTAAIECHEWYFSPAVIAYGNTVVNNCTMTGATTTREPITDKHGVAHEVIPVDFGVRNESDAVINNSTFDTFFAWTHAVVDIYGSTIGTLYCGTCDSTKHSWMTIHSGTTIDRVICCEPRCPYGTKEYSTTMTIKKGAQVGSLQLVSTDVEFLIIEDGASVGKITCEGVEYTYEELRAAMGL